MEVGTGAISEGFGQDDWGERDDHSQLGEGEDEADKKEFGEIEGNFENLRVGS
jgi:hypothetical protein